VVLLLRLHRLLKLAPLLRLLKPARLLLLTDLALSLH
jgi:hypothetical protein